MSRIQKAYFLTDEDDEEEGEEILDSGPEESSETSITIESRK